MKLPNQKEIKAKYWLSQLEICLTSIATLELRLKTLETIKDDEKVGEKESGRIGSGLGKIIVTAKEMREEVRDELEKKCRIQKAIEELLKE